MHLGIIFLALLQGTCTFLSGRWAAQAAEGVTIRLRDFLYDHIQRLSFAYHSQTPTGELIQRATSDVDAMRLFYSEQAVGLGRIVLLFLVNFTALLLLNWQLALISVIVVPVLLIVSVLFFGKIAERYEAFQAQEAVLSTTLQENLTGIRVVRAFARQEYEEDKFEADNRERYERGIRLLLMHAVYWPSTDILVGAQLLVGYFVGAMMAINGTITVGQYLAYAGLIIWLIWPIRNLGRLIDRYLKFTSEQLAGFEDTEANMDRMMPDCQLVVWFKPRGVLRDFAAPLRRCSDLPVVSAMRFH